MGKILLYGPRWKTIIPVLAIDSQYFFVYDKNSFEPIPDVLVYVREMNLWFRNKSGLYKSDEHGRIMDIPLRGTLIPYAVKPGYLPAQGANGDEIIHMEKISDYVMKEDHDPRCLEQEYLKQFKNLPETKPHSLWLEWLEYHRQYSEI